MPKESSEDLYLLIHSLTRNEKGYFKKFSFYHQNEDGTNKYIKLFDMLNNQKKFNEKNIIEEFKKTGQHKHFSSLKNYLFNLILASLRNFYSDGKDEMHVNNLIEEANILYLKGFSANAKTYILKAKKLAYQIEYFSGILSAINFEIYLNLLSKEINYQHILALISERQQLIQKITDAEKYNTANIKIYPKIQKSKMYDNTVHLLVKQIKNLLSEKYSQPLSLTAKADQLKLSYIYFSVSNDYKNAVLSVESLVTELKKHSPIRKEWKWNRAYFTALSNYVFHLNNLRKYKLTESLIAELETISKEIQISNPREQARNFESMFTMQLQYYLFTGQSKKAEKILMESDAEIKKYYRFLIPFYQIRMAHIAGMNMFALAKYDQALEYMRQIITYKKAESLEIFYIKARLTEILIHIELKNYLLIESLLAGIERYVREKPNLEAAIPVIIGFIKKYTANKTKNEQKSIMLNTKEQLEKLFSSQLDKEIIDWVLIIPYLEHKMKNTNLQEEVKKYFQ